MAQKSEGVFDAGNHADLVRALKGQVGTSSVITESQEESRHMSSAILQSKKLLTKYGRREMTDRVLILLAVVFFFACVLYVLKRRLF